MFYKVCPTSKNRKINKIKFDHYKQQGNSSGTYTIVTDANFLMKHLNLT